MTEKEIAELRLAAWNAINGWGVINTIFIDGKAVPNHQPLDWKARQEKADDLLAWMLSPFPMMPATGEDDSGDHAGPGEREGGKT